MNRNKTTEKTPKKAESINIKKELTKEDRIKKEISRLKKIYGKVDEKMQKAIDELIKNTAFMCITLQEMQKSINKNGTQIEYRNSETQYGSKANPDVANYNSMFKNYAAAVKQLNDILPTGENKIKEDELEDFISQR